MTRAKNKIVDIQTNMQVIGCVYLNPSLIEQSDKYSFSLDDFTEDFHKTIFGSIYNLFQLGARQIDVSTIEEFLSTRPKNYGIYKANNGAKWLDQVSKMAQPSAFTYYYNRMKKFTLLRMYDDVGLDISDLYDVDNVFDVKKKQKQEEWLDNTSLSDIADSIDDKIIQIKLKYANITEKDFHQAAEGIDDLIESLKTRPEVGSPLYGSLINTVTRGARLGKFYLRSMPSGTGKALPNDTLIPTPDGWRKVGNIKPGDYLFGQNGRPTKVLAIHPQSESKQVWEVVFKDGRTVKCCKDHLWEYRYNRRNPNSLRVESTEEIYKRALKETFKEQGKGAYKFAVKVNSPVAYPEKELFVDPYVMGVLLGDGSFRYQDSQKCITFSSETDEIPNKIAALLGDDIIAIKNSDFNYTYRFKSKKDFKHNIWVEEIFKNYPSLWNLKSEDKFIPSEYLLGSIEQRLKLLQGLMDTDGSIDEKGRVSYFTISSKLKDNIVELCRSLGMITSVTLDKRKEKYTATQCCFKISVQCKKSIKPYLFTLKRKKDIAEAAVKDGRREEKKEFLPIIDIRKTNEYTDMTCFTVDNKDHLFLTNDFIVTHNTRMMVADACNMACDTLYDKTEDKWVKNGVKESSLYITTEQRLDEVQTAMLAFLAEVDEEHILTGRYEDDEEERILYAANVLKNSPLHIKYLPDFSLQDIENTIKFAVHDWNIKYVFFDYLHSSMKILSEVSSKAKVANLREDNVLFMISTRLKDLCNEYGVFIMTSTQLNGGWTDADVYDQNLLRGSKAVADRVDVGMIGLDTTERDKEALVDIVSRLGIEMPEMKISVYKNRRGRWKGILLWCKADRSTCRINPIFVTNYNYELLPIEETNIQVMNFEDEDEK